MSQLLSETYEKNDKDQIIMTKKYIITVEQAEIIKNTLEQEVSSLQKKKIENYDEKITDVTTKLDSLSPLIPIKE